MTISNGKQLKCIMHLPLILVSAFYAGVAQSTNCYNCINSNNEALSGQRNTCNHPFNPTTAVTCTGDFCLVTTQFYSVGSESVATYWRQCGSSTSLPQGASTTSCPANDIFYPYKFYVDRNLCCYDVGYTQTQYSSNVTTCFCTSDLCNDLLYRTNFSSSDSTTTRNPSQLPATTNPSQLPATTNPSQLSTTTKSANAGDILSGNALGALLIPIVSTGVVALAMIFCVTYLWNRASKQPTPRYKFIFYD